MKQMREVMERMSSRLANGGEESSEEGGDSDRADAGAPSSPDLDEQADLGFGHASPSQHETAFVERGQKEVKRKN